MNYRSKVAAVLVIVGLGVIIWGLAGKRHVSSVPGTSGTELPVISLSPTPTPTYVHLPGTTLTQGWYAQFKGPATCTVSGSVRYISPSIAENSARLDYRGIDSAARQIWWTVSPKDDIKVGPNIDASLKLPDGSNMVTLTLPTAPVAKQYTLTAAMTYGRLVDGGIKVYQAQCSGSIGVTLAY